MVFQLAPRVRGIACVASNSRNTYTSHYHRISYLHRLANVRHLKLSTKADIFPCRGKPPCAMPISRRAYSFRHGISYSHINPLKEKETNATPHVLDKLMHFEKVCFCTFHPPPVVLVSNALLRASCLASHAVFVHVKIQDLCLKPRAVVIHVKNTRFMPRIPRRVRTR